MQSSSVSKPPAGLLAVLAAAGIALCLPSCKGETADNGSDEGATDHAKSALTQVTAYDFIANAAGAGWYNNDGKLPWGTNSTTISGAPGACMTASGALEDGSTPASPFLYTNPKLAADGYLRGAYTVKIPAASLHPTLTAKFGFKQGASGTDGVTFAIATQVPTVVGGEYHADWVNFFRQKKTSTGALSTATADLSAYGGTTITVLLTVDAGANATNDWAVWTDVRLLADSAPAKTDCTIGAVGYATGDVNPASSCQTCDPTSSTTQWTTRGDSCVIGGACYSAGANDTFGCKQCDPGVSQTSWTNKASCDKLIIGVTTTSMSGGSLGGQTGADALCASQGSALGLPGTWKSLVSSNGSGGQDYKDRVPSWFASMPVVNLQGQQLYSTWNSIFTNQVWPSGLSIYQFGSAAVPAGSAYSGYVWTGTAADGTWLDIDEGADPDPGRNCKNWTQNVTLIIDDNNARLGDWSTRRLVDGVTGGPSVSTYCSNTSRRVGCVLVPSAPIVTVANPDNSAIGTVQGITQLNTYAYLGVPYAAPPVGAFRFKVPQSVPVPSGGTIVATGFKPPCPQKPFLPWANNIGSEDCLYLNIWRPQTGSNLPVVVFHHGGGLIFGGAAAVADTVGPGFFNGERLANDKSMIVVTLQTRLGALGYLATSELSTDSSSSTNGGGSSGTSGNYGVMDAIQALKWIKKNISGFGGDPNKVVFAGQSGGATLGAMLLASPLAQGYLSGAYLMSGFYEEPTMQYRYGQVTANSNAVLNKLKANCTDSTHGTVACLRTAPVSNFVNATADILAFAPSLIDGFVTPEEGFGLVFGPNVDGSVIPVQPRAVYANSGSTYPHPKVPVILGSTKNDFYTFMLLSQFRFLDSHNIVDMKPPLMLLTCNEIIPGNVYSFVGRTNWNLGTTMATAARTLYPCSMVPGNGPNETYAKALTHAQYECPVRRAARALVTGQPTVAVRRYWFTHVADGRGVFQNVAGLAPQVGAAHMLDIPFFFNHFETPINVNGPGGIFNIPQLPPFWLQTYSGASARERTLTSQYQTLIRNFANTGDPNCSTTSSCVATSDPSYWAKYSLTQDAAYNIKAAGEAGVNGPEMTNAAYPNGIDTAECDFWDGHFALTYPNGTPPPAAGGDPTCTPACSGKVCGLDGCGGTCGTCGSGTQCNTAQTACVAPTATATVTGFTTCTCLNGTFQLTNLGGGVYSSGARTGCPGQSQPAYVKFNESGVALGIASASGSPGSGNSDYSPGTVTSSSPYQASGNGATSGNINSFCPGVEDTAMHWTVTKP